MKVGDKVKLNLKSQIEKYKLAKKKDKLPKSLLELWEAIDGCEGVITEINGNEIWVKGNRTEIERLFNRETLEVV